MKTRRNLVAVLALALAATAGLNAETHKFVPAAFHTTFSAAHPVVLKVKSGDNVVTSTLDDMGIDQKRSRLAISLPAPLTLSFIPYGYHLPELVAAARAAGHEVMLHMPMEPLDAEADPGPNALRTSVSIEENQRRLLWAFSRIDGVELNVLGLNFGLGPNGLKLPIVGRVGSGWKAALPKPMSGTNEPASPVPTTASP